MTDTQLIRMCGLFENTSKDGNTYFVGVAGGVKILILRNKNAGEGEPGWNLCFTARPDKPATARAEVAAAPIPRKRRPRSGPRPVSSGHDPERGHAPTPC